MVYLDYNATTPLAPEALAAMIPFLRDAFGNASSIHAVGRQSRAAVDDSRERMASLLGVKAHEIIFTSGGTEACNLAVLGIARAHGESVALAMRQRGDPRAQFVPLQTVDRLIAIGSDRMMAAVKAARYGALAPYLKPEHVGIASINSPMQCMMKEVCAQCLQKHVDPKTGKESIIFSCFNQDQDMDGVDFSNLAARLRQNTVQEKLSGLWFDYLLRRDGAGHAGQPAD
jgi:hypothetical protein